MSISEYDVINAIAGYINNDDDVNDVNDDDVNVNVNDDEDDDVDVDYIEKDIEPSRDYDIDDLIKMGLIEARFGTERKTMLFIATENEAPNEIISYLIRKGSNVDAQISSGATSLLIAIDKISDKENENNLINIQILIENSRNLDLQNDGGIFPLIYAMNRLTVNVDESIETIKLLLDNGCSVNKRCTRPGMLNCTPIMLLLIMADLPDDVKIEVLGYILDQNSKRDISQNSKRIVDINALNDMGRDALNLYVAYTFRQFVPISYDIVKMLLAHGSNPNLVPHKPAILYAMTNEYQNQRVINLLLDYATSKKFIKDFDLNHYDETYNTIYNLASEDMKRSLRNKYRSKIDTRSPEQIEYDETMIRINKRVPLPEAIFQNIKNTYLFSKKKSRSRSRSRSRSKRSQ